MRRFTHQFGIFTVALSMATVFSACTPKDDGSTGSIDLTNVKGDQFSSQDRNLKIAVLKDKYNLNIVLEDTSYESEYVNNRVLRYLTANIESIKGAFVNAIEVRIGQRMQRSEISSGKISISLSNRATERELNMFLMNLQNSYQVDSSLSLVKTRIGLSELTDAVGMTAAQADVFGTNLTAAMAGFDLSLPYAQQMIAKVYVDHFYAIGAGWIIVPFNASAPDLTQFIAEAVALSKHLSTDISDLKNSLGVGVSFQSGVLTASEITHGMQNLTANSGLFRNAKRTKVSVMIGRRTENDASLVKSNRILLVAFNASSDELSAAIKLLDLDVAASLQSDFNTFHDRYAAAGVNLTFTISDVITTFGSTEAAIPTIKNFLAQFEQVASPARLSALRINSVSTGYSGSLGSVNQSANGTAVLNFSINGFNPSQIDNAIAGYSQLNIRTQRLELQRQILKDLSYGYSDKNISTSYSDADFDLSNDSTTAALGQFSMIMKRVAAPERLAAAKIDSIVISKGAPSASESVLIVGNKLRVDPYLMNESVLEDSLKRLEDSEQQTPPKKKTK